MSEPAPLAGRIPALSGIRGPAIIAVICFHAGLYAQFPGALSGVEMFFCLSGFLITGVLLRQYRQAAGDHGLGRIDYRGFLLRRAVRILPLLVVISIVSFAALTVLTPGASPRLDQQLRHALSFTMDYYQSSRPTAPLTLGHLWSLGVEEKFYLFWPPLLALVLRLCRRRPRAAALLLAQLSLLAYAYPAFRIIPIPHAFPNVYFAADTRLGGLLAGCALAMLLHTAPSVAARMRNRWLGVVGVGVLIALIGWQDQVVSPGPRQILIVLALAGAASAMLIGHLACSDGGPTARVFAARPVVWLGDRSYAAYLLQLPITSILRFDNTMGAVPAALAGTALSFGLAEVARLCVELPAARWAAARISGQRPWIPRPSHWGVVHTSVAVASASVVGWASRGYTVDDGDIVLRYVHNALVNRGWVWNVGSARNACTSFLHPLLVLLLSALGCSTDAASHVVGTLGLVIAAASAAALLGRMGLPFAGLATAALLPFLPCWTNTSGLETSLFVGLLLAYAARAANGRLDGRLVAAVSLCRPDGILLLPVALVRRLWRPGWLRFALLAATPFLILLFGSYAVTGSPLPASVGIKAQQGASPLFAIYDYLPNVLTQVDFITHDRTATWVVIGWSAFSLVLFAFRRAFAIVELNAFVLLQTAAYTVGHVIGQYWYYVPLLVVMGVTGLGGAEWALRLAVQTFARLPSARWARAGRPAAISGLVAGLASLVVVGTGLNAWAAEAKNGLAPREHSYFLVADWLRQRGLAADASVGSSEVGAYGVRLPDNRIDDVVGLTTTPTSYAPCCTEDFLRKRTTWLALHLYPLPAPTPEDTLVSRTLARLSLESGVPLVAGQPPGAQAVTVWSVDAPLVTDPHFPKLYRLVAVVETTGALPQAVFERRDTTS